MQIANCSQNESKEDLQMSKKNKTGENGVSAEVDTTVNAPKVKFTIYVFPETMKTLETLYKADNCSTKTEYIERAIRFYNGFLLQNKPELVEYLAPQMAEITDGIIRGSETRLSRAIFKLAVEVGVQSHILAATNDVDLGTLNKLRSMVIDDVRKSNGIINFESAVRYQKDL